LRRIGAVINISMIHTSIEFIMGKIYGENGFNDFKIFGNQEEINKYEIISSLSEKLEHAKRETDRTKHLILMKRLIGLTQNEAVELMKKQYRKKAECEEAKTQLHYSPKLLKLLTGVKQDRKLTEDDFPGLTRMVKKQIMEEEMAKRAEEDIQN